MHAAITRLHFKEPVDPAVLGKASMISHPRCRLLEASSSATSSTLDSRYIRVYTKRNTDFTEVNGTVYAEERHQLIVERARLDGRVEVGELATELDVTAETIRRDLTTLERHGVLSRVHGGAIPCERLGLEPGLAVRGAAMQAEKERIAKAALDELPQEGAVLLDAGTT